MIKKVIFTFCLTLLVVCFFASNQVSAATIEVDTLTDEWNLDPSIGPACSLREAIRSANEDIAFGGCDIAGDPGLDHIVFNATQANGMITFIQAGIDEENTASGDLDITADLDITGLGTGITIINANNLDRVFDVMNGATVTLSQLDITGGENANAGGGIKVDDSASLNLDHVDIYNNEVINGFGGGINMLESASANITNSNINNNTAYIGGGGIFFSDAASALNITNSHVDNNTSETGSGGGINAFFFVFTPNPVENSITINNSSISNNNAGLYGGGIAKGRLTNMLITGSSVISNNTSNYNNANPFGVGGGIFTGSSPINNSGKLTIEDGSSVIFNDSGETHGGGIFISEEAIVEINNAFIDNNTAGGNGGGIYFDHYANELNIINSHIDSNTSEQSGGGIYTAYISTSPFQNNNLITIDNSSFSDNNAGLFGGGIAKGRLTNMLITGSSVISNNTSNYNNANPFGVGGGIFTRSMDNGSGVLTIQDKTSITLNNSGETHGGGIFIAESAITNIIDTFIDNNTAGGSGGGIYFDELAKTLNINRSTLSGNSSTISINFPNVNGGALYAKGESVSLKNSTISTNSSIDSGSAIFVDSLANVALDSSTIAYNNNSVSIDNNSGGTLTTKNSIFDNTSNCNGTINSDGYNLDTGFSCNFNSQGDLQNANAGLAALVPYLPGEIPTHAIDLTSDAFNNGSTDLTVDQRGTIRPYAGLDDIGAFEFDNFVSLLITLTENAPIPASTNQTPGYSFSSSAAGNITYYGDCIGDLSYANVGSNSLIFSFNGPATGLHNNCSIKVTDPNNPNNIGFLYITPFTISAESSSTSTGGSGSAGGFNNLITPPTGSQVEPPVSTPTTPPVISDPVVFPDVVDHWAQQYIENLQLYCGYLNDSNGNALNLFNPNDYITREDLIRILIQCAEGEQSAIQISSFADININRPSAPYIQKAFELGIVEGYAVEGSEERVFKPTAHSTRAEALKMILLTYIELSVVAAAEVDYRCIDVDQKEWYAKYFNYAKNVVSGYKDENGNLTGFCGPGNNITRAESAKIIINVLP
jgi:CSLREA domain-containing protein